MLRFHDTYSGKKEEFKPLNKNKASMYTCGPTVYDYAHIGNLRAYLFEDLLRRTLKLCGYEVTQIMNITDVDDKTIREAVKAKISLDDYTQKFIDAFHDDLKELAIEKAEMYPRATRHIPDMIALIEQLIEKGYAYESEGNVYYRVQKFPDYGKLSKKDLEENIAGARVDVDEYNKESLTDFALWKKKKEADEPSWPSPYGEGRPGWHIECSVMSMKYLGETFDIHTGGEDNIFPHHENEIAQSEAVTGRKFVHFWLHCKFLLVDGHKMSKSLGNFYTLRDLINKGYEPLAVRYLLITHHYRHPVNFTFKGLEEAQYVLQRIKDFYFRIEEYSPKTEEDKVSVKIEEATENFKKCLMDDLNISGALGVFFDLMHDVNNAIMGETFSSKSKQLMVSFFETFNQVLGLNALFVKDEIPEEIVQLANERQEARKNKDFNRADEIRDGLSEKGFVVEDTKDGIRIKKS